MRAVAAPRRPAAWACWVVVVMLGAVCSATSPDSAGLVGSSPERPTLPFKLWARSPKSALKPRRRDLRESDLRRLLGDDLDARWMRVRGGGDRDRDRDRGGGGGHPAHDQHQQEKQQQQLPPEGPRPSVMKLAALASREPLPEGLALLGGAAQAVVREWLVRRATCPVRYAWIDLGPYFWPRWVRRGQCSAEDAPATTTTLAPAGSTSSTTTSTTTTAAPTAGAEAGAGAAMVTRSCSWPPGMRCVPSAAKVLHLLRWHCRLRKSALSNSVWLQPADRKRRRRKRFRCQWLKVPYPVPEDCTCAP